jgi:hypothetical protein
MLRFTDRGKASNVLRRPTPANSLCKIVGDLRILHSVERCPVLAYLVDSRRELVVGSLLGVLAGVRWLTAA